MRIRSSLFAILAASMAMPVFAGPFGDDMAKCLVRATTSEDKTTLVKWMFAVMSVHPDVKAFAQVPEAARARLNSQMGTLMTALLTDRCAKESREAVKNEGMSAIESSFNVLGQVAAQELFTNAEVTAGLTEFSKNIDEKKLKAALGGE